jgi:hypothetical protein
MSHHTRGPWGLHPELTCGDGRAIIALIHPQQVTVARTQAVRAGLPPDQRIEREEAEANAVLISAAPQLLEALEDLVAFYRREMAGFVAADAVERAALAIAKAKRAP